MAVAYVILFPTLYVILFPTLKVSKILAGASSFSGDHRKTFKKNRFDPARDHRRFRMRPLRP